MNAGAQVRGKECNPGWFRGLVHAGETAIDVGAADGEMAIELARLVGRTGRVIACEPRAGTASCELIAQAQTWPQISVQPVLVGAMTGRRDFYLSSDPKQSNCYALDGGHHAVPTPCVRLDDLYDGPVALVKIDAQASELEILEGAAKMLAQCPIWIVEAWPRGLKHAKTSAVALWDRLTSAGLTVYHNLDLVKRVDVEAWDERERPPVHCDWIAVR